MVSGLCMHQCDGDKGYCPVLAMDDRHDGVERDAVAFVADATNRHQQSSYCSNLEDGLDVTVDALL